MTEVSSNKTFGGFIRKYKATAESLGGLSTQWNVFVPSGAGPFPVLYYLAGLTCNEDTGAWKGTFLPVAAAEGISLVFPDTSPRGANIEGEEESWDFGTGAGFYLDATAEKWSKHYRMFTFITEELPNLLRTLSLPLDLTRQSIFGHSMGGHGALTLYLKKRNQYRSASAFAPVSHPTKAPWGKKAFSNYLQGGIEEGETYDATCLLQQVKADGNISILVDYGDGDQFYKDGQLLPEALVDASKKAGFTQNNVNIRMQEGYDHSYYFISTFAEEHIRFHAKHLKA
ncbi:hypothetical protein FRC18_005464 [Serendipita sp. 400]|nr:hypothetical protein FRC18_005464 [Serendipita sp. 400]